MLFKGDTKLLQTNLNLLQNFLKNPLTDIVDRFNALAKKQPLDITLYAAKEFLNIVNAVASQPNVVTKKFDYSGAYRVFMF